MAKRVRTAPSLPNVTADAGESLVALNRSLYQEGIENNFRLNLAFPKDGTEPFEAPMPMQSVATADLPPAAEWEGATVYDTTTNELKYSDGTNWITVASASNGRIRLTGDTTFTVGTAQDYTTLQDAWNDICTNYDMAGFDVTFDLIDGTYAGLDDHAPGTTSIDEQIDGVKPVGGGVIKIVGNTTTPANVVISSTTYGIRMAHSHVEIHGIRFDDATSTGDSILAAWQGQIVIGDAVVFGRASQHMHASSGGRIILADSSAGYTIDDDATIHWFCDSLGHIRVTDGQITLTGTPAFSSSFAVATDGGVMQLSNLTFSGTATGTRFTILGAGIISTGTNSLTYIPGNVAGILGTGGQYDDFYDGLDVVIASGSFPAANNVNIPIFEGIKKVFVNIAGASSNTATRYPLVRISTDGGSTYATTGYTSLGLSATPALLTDDTGLLSGFTAVAAARSWTINGTIEGLTGGSGIHAQWTGVTDDFSAGPVVAHNYMPSTTSRVTHIRITWNGTGNFDGGTYSVRTMF